MARFVHSDAIRERRNMQEMRSSGDPIHQCRSCYMSFGEPKEVCPNCGFRDDNSVHGATQLEVDC